jgi:hypothetical protein
MLSADEHGEVSLTVAPLQFAVWRAASKLPVRDSTSASNVKLGDNTPLVLTVRAEGTPPLEYQWLRDDMEITGATASSLTIEPGKAVGGRYSVLVRNRAGTVVSPVTEIFGVP